MPIARWYCARCRADVPLDHFATTECGETVCHPDVAAAILHHDRNQHVRGVVRVTTGLGCPRRSVIEHTEEYAVDPLDANAMLTGTAWHALMEAHGGEEAEVSVAGTLAGVKVAGKSDKMRGSLVEDHKNVADAKAPYIRKDGPSRGHIVQLSIYAELAEQSGRPRPTRGIIWYHTSKAGADALIPVPVELLHISEALEFKPGEGEFSVAELYAQAEAGIASGDWRAMPLAGRTQQFGKFKTACDYCGVRAICTEGEKGAPF